MRPNKLIIAFALLLAFALGFFTCQTIDNHAFNRYQGVIKSYQLMIQDLSNPDLQSNDFRDPMKRHLDSEEQTI